MNDTTEDLRARRLDDVSRLVAAKVAPDQRATLQAFIERYYGQVDPEDLLERQRLRPRRMGRKGRALLQRPPRKHPSLLQLPPQRVIVAPTLD